MIDTAGANENDTRRERLWKRRVRVRFRRREERGLRRRLRDAEQMKQDNYRKKKRDASDTLKLSNMDDVLISTFHFYLMAIIHSVHSHINISFSYIYIYIYICYDL
jgi:hypothetical protein